MTLFSAAEIILQHYVLSHRIDAYFSKYKLAIEVDEQEHNDRDIDFEIKRQKKLIQIKKILVFLLKLGKYKITLLNQLKN